jgi:toxin CcdB
MQCDVHRNVGEDAGPIPYLLNVQADLLSSLETRVVIPLVRKNAFGRTARRLHPVFTVEGEELVLATHLIAAVRSRSLGPTVASLADQRDVVISAVDVLWSGV